MQQDLNLKSAKMLKSNQSKNDNISILYCLNFERLSLLAKNWCGLYIGGCATPLKY